jgi:uncharacterized protein
MALESRDKAGRSALHYAAADGDFDHARSLIESGADVSLPDQNGWTPLHFAAQRQSAEIIDLLLRSGAKVDPVDRHGNTPLGTAIFNYRSEGKPIEALLAAGADENLQNHYGVSPRSLAHTIANYDVRKFFP